MDNIPLYLPWIIMIVNGIIAGWLASKVLGGNGLFRNLIVGIVGSVVGGLLVTGGLLNLPFNFGSWGNQIIISTIGALIVIIIVRIIRWSS